VYARSLIACFAGKFGSEGHREKLELQRCGFVTLVQQLEMIQ
jgi:hypothetical protein